MIMPSTFDTIAPLFFLSDVHLGVGSPQEEARKLDSLLALLDHVRARSGALCIVGDLFDFWYEYRSVVPRGWHRLYCALDSLTREGLPVLYLAGNHDFAIGGFFRDDLGMRVWHDDLLLHCEGQVFYVYHGDGLAQKDGGYRLLKRLLRARWSQFLYRLLHPDLAFGIARRFSHSSRDYTSGKFYGETDGMLLEARRRIDAGARYVIMGHRHKPCIEAVGDGTYVNLGDWIRHFSFAMYDRNTLALYRMNGRNIEAWSDPS